MSLYNLPFDKQYSAAVIIRLNVNLKVLNCIGKVKRVLYKRFRSLCFPPGCLLNVVCCLLDIYIRPHTFIGLTKTSAVYSTSDKSAGQRPERGRPILMREGKPLMQFVWRRALSNQMEARLTYLKQLALFTSAPKAMSGKGKRNMLAWANYHGFHV